MGTAMDEMVYTFTTPNDIEATRLLDELSQVLQEITGDDGRSSFAKTPSHPQHDTFLIARQDGVPVACGAFRRIDERTCELKRMYSRVQGGGGKILGQLEATAKESGYTLVILSTRRVNTRAVRFYQRHGYREISAYGKYRHSNVSICLGKAL